MNAITIELNGFSIRIRKAREGVSCEVFQVGREAGAPIDSCFVYDSVLKPVCEDCGDTIGQDVIGESELCYQCLVEHCDDWASSDPEEEDNEIPN
jgi:hypothetical protein